jgi:hypothetical protein
VGAEYRGYPSVDTTHGVTLGAHYEWQNPNNQPPKYEQTPDDWLQMAYPGLGLEVEEAEPTNPAAPETQEPTTLRLGMTVAERRKLFDNTHHIASFTGICEDSRPAVVDSTAMAVTSKLPKTHNRRTVELLTTGVL